MRILQSRLHWIFNMMVAIASGSDMLGAAWKKKLKSNLS